MSCCKIIAMRAPRENVASRFEGRCHLRAFQSQLLLPLSLSRCRYSLLRVRVVRIHGSPADIQEMTQLMSQAGMQLPGCFQSGSHHPDPAPGTRHAMQGWALGSFAAACLCTWLLSSLCAPGRGLPGAFSWSWGFVAACPGDEALRDGFFSSSSPVRFAPRCQESPDVRQRPVPGPRL